jgi:hypothetical protein
MTLTDLDPRWVGAGGDGIYNTAPDGTLVPAPPRHGVGISFRCPCGTHPRDDEYDTDRVVILFNNPLDGGGKFDATPEGHCWDRTGDTFETLKLSPSIQRLGGCRWHGYVGLAVPGEVTTC